MSARSRLPLSKDEELGKRDDDFRPRLPRSPPMTAILPWRWRKRRTLGLLLLVALLCLLLRYLPTPFTLDSSDSAYTNDPYLAAAASSDPAGAPPRPLDADVNETYKQYYNGPIRFYKLAQSLSGIQMTMGTMALNRNVLFVASSTKSAANIIPMACDMARIERNHAHFALFGRSTIPLDEILLLNGVEENSCPVYFHDARGDFPEYSTDARIEAAIKGAMRHINDFMHPQAIIMDDSTKEDVFFAKAIRSKAKALNLDKALIEVPSGRYEEWLWLTRLEALSLSAWHKPNIEVLIHAPVGSSGGLIRLLRSLYNADYRGLKTPRLTVELPSDVEPFLGRYLSGFRWPPGRDDGQPDSLTLRHRIPNSRIGSEQASIRFVESFYPSDRGNNHVLILSPHVEVSPLYLQYLYQTVLEYHAITLGWYSAQDVLGVALDVPTTLVNGKTSFTPPPLANLTINKYPEPKEYNKEDPSPFLYQGLSSAAILVFGERWATFHDFLNKRLQASRSGKKGRTRKVVSETEPAWVEFLLELMRARGWTVLHPPSSFVTVHNDLAQIPEEFARSPGADNIAPLESSDVKEEEPFILSTATPVLVEHIETDTTRTHMPLHEFLPFKGELQAISDMPVITHLGEGVEASALGAQAEEYTTWFRAAIGGCQGDQASRPRIKKDLNTDDLFCLPGVDLQFADYDEWDAELTLDVTEVTAESTDDALIFSKTSSDVTEPTKSPSTVESTSEAGASVEDNEI